MQPYSSSVFFYVIFFFISIVWLVGKKFSSKYFQWLLFLGTILFTVVAFRSSSKKIFLFSLFYILIIKLALSFRNWPRKFFVFMSLIPLIVIKLSEAFPIFTSLHGKFIFVGISYLSFRVIQILLDIDFYTPQSFLNILVFLLNPLTLLAGPIDRFHRFEKNIIQINDSINKNNFISGWYFLLFGLLQKFILAYFWDQLFMSQFSVHSAHASDVIGIAYTYAVYLFLDFSGYSLMAVGLGYMMGIILPQNFNQPWKTKNPQDLWRRFHITLGSFLNDYFFKPIYMSFLRKTYFKSHKLFAQNLALFLTFLLMGAWNGLKWNYLLSGGMFGLASVVYNTYQSKYKISQHFLLTRGPIMIYRFLFLNYVVWALYFFSGKMPQ